MFTFQDLILFGSFLVALLTYLAKEKRNPRETRSISFSGYRGTPRMLMQAWHSPRYLRK